MSHPGLRCWSPTGGLPEFTRCGGSAGRRCSPGDDPAPDRRLGSGLGVRSGQRLGVRRRRELGHAPPLPASLARIAPRTRQVATAPSAGAPSAGFGSLWVRAADTIARYDPSTRRTIARIPVPRVIATAFGDGRVWALSQSANTSDPNRSTATLTQIDPRSNRAVGTPTHLRTSQPIAIAVSGHNLWIADCRGALLHFKLTHH